jgi:hypothetical protein
MPYTIFEICLLISFDRGIGTRRLRTRVIRIPDHGFESEKLVVLHALTCEIVLRERKDVGKEFVLRAGSIRWASGVAAPCIHIGRCARLIGSGPPLGMPQSGSEPKFEPELFRTGPKFGPRFDGRAEPDHKSGSRFGRGPKSQNRVEPGPNRTFL